MEFSFGQPNFSNCESIIRKNSRRWNILKFNLTEFIIFKPLSYCFEETIGLETKKKQKPS